MFAPKNFNLSEELINASRKVMEQKYQVVEEETELNEEEEALFEAFEEFLEENFYVDQLTEEEVEYLLDMFINEDTSEGEAEAKAKAAKTKTDNPTNSSETSWADIASKAGSKIKDFASSSIDTGAGLASKAGEYVKSAAKSALEPKPDIGGSLDAPASAIKTSMTGTSNGSSLPPSIKALQPTSPDVDKKTYSTGLNPPKAAPAGTKMPGKKEGFGDVPIDRRSLAPAPASVSLAASLPAFKPATSKTSSATTQQTSGTTQQARPQQAKPQQTSGTTQQARPQAPSISARKPSSSGSSYRETSGQSAYDSPGKPGSGWKERAFNPGTGG